MDFLSTPFDEKAADMLAGLGVPAFKISSGDLTHLPLLDRVAREDRPVILSTGMAGLAEVERAVETVTRAGNEHLALLHCVSAYPADPADANLRAMDTLRERFRLPVGFSDHTPGVTVALASAARGAAIIEKHLTLDRGLPGPDHHASLEPETFRRMVDEIRQVETALGDGIKQPAPAEKEVAEVARRSLHAGAVIPAGAKIAPEWLVGLRPGTGIPVWKAPELVGRRARRPIPKGTMLQVEMFE
jgi:N-acetylneuraminate synthase/N,N'-diacetyllegionaminate synthase